MDYGITTTILGVSLLVFSIIVSIVSTRKHKRLVDAYPTPTIVYMSEADRNQGTGVTYRAGMLRRVRDRGRLARFPQQKEDPQERRILPHAPHLLEGAYGEE